jgi:nitroreductase
MVSPLTVDEVLTTTRAVRQRLDFTRAVERQVLEACLAAAQQAPSGGNLQTWGFVVLTERDKRAALADLYRQGYHTFLSTPIAEAIGYGNPQVTPAQRHVTASIDYLVENLAKVPVFVIPCIAPRAGAADGIAARHVRLDHAGGLELHARGAGARSRHLLDHLSPLL